jgi:hypothetical protein
VEVSSVEPLVKFLEQEQTLSPFGHLVTRPGANDERSSRLSAVPVKTPLIEHPPTAGEEDESD